MMDGVLNLILENTELESSSIQKFIIACFHSSMDVAYLPRVLRGQGGFRDQYKTSLRYHRLRKIGAWGRFMSKC